MLRILHNHLGYFTHGAKRALVQSNTPLKADKFSIYDANTREPVFHGELSTQGPVARWRDWKFWEADFSALKVPGKYFLAIDGISPALTTSAFGISDRLYDGQYISDLLHYFKSQRCTGLYDNADRSRPKFGSQERRDVHGGWFDASGDVSKYLSHLSYANFMNPQQIPQVVWNLIDGRHRLPQQSVWLDERMVDEALHGADFLMRAHDPAGYFYMTIFDRWTKDIAQRDICSYATQKGLKADTYQAGYRQGGGIAIAALARASTLPRDGEYARAEYLTAAERGFAHLEANNLSYLDDGRENIIDDYCALMAAVELFAATSKDIYADAAARRALRLTARQSEEGWFWADDAKTRSYFHAAEAGLPYVALLRFAEVLENLPSSATALAAVKHGLAGEIRLTREGDANPFRYPRQHVVMPGKPARIQFFIPHENESGYWWQGENARLASLASAANWAAHVFQDDQAAAIFASYARDVLDWIFGFNPFDACMMQGLGRNNPRYEVGFFNAPGGVCNGITSGLKDEEDIDFISPEDTLIDHSWRWNEQWIPHGSWLFHALSHMVQFDGGRWASTTSSEKPGLA
jgi:hypothetical protein